MYDNEADKPINAQMKSMDVEKSSLSFLSVLFISGWFASIIEGIIWLLWIFHGRPDNWFGKISRFRQKTGIGFLAIILICAVCCAVVRITRNCVQAKTSEENYEEIR